MWQLANKKYNELKEMGSRPSREIDPNPGPCPPSKSYIDKGYHVRDHWGREVGRLRDETARWLDFRWHQFKMRESLVTFMKYKQAVHRYRQKKRISWAVELQLDRQTKLDEWGEYYLYELQKRDPLDKELEQANQELKLAKDRTRQTERNGPAEGFAKRCLKAQKPDTFEQLNGAERTQEQQHDVNTRLEQLDALLEWITGQAAKIATEYAHATDSGRDVLKGWEKYYAYMRERLQVKQDQEDEWWRRGWTKGRTETEEKRDDLLYPKERVRPIKALLAWIEREFPKIAAQYGIRKQRNGKSAQERPPLSQLQPSKGKLKNLFYLRSPYVGVNEYPNEHT
ncbi:hypothetical protein P154DRAFT_616917 [Amniculicola lignicola CBS 123094]|uniref:Uncharacterized protein n=1 Tax=Amniculicola lignicola CBS 123094 TaxID=1392246 RepID=A0A6A5WW31_9PLEO|nr:hypothetical protein P154DRAFT_616917 [Amniculicola lignicola CBS 123094]